MAKTGRPSLCTPDLCDDICRRIAMGAGLAEALRAITAEKGSAPAYDTVIEWLGKEGEAYERFTRNYTRAREHQAEWDADHIRKIARDLEQCTDRDVAEAKYKAAQLYQWNAGKRKPKAFGDKVQAEVSGPEGAPLKVVIERAADGG